MKLRPMPVKRKPLKRGLFRKLHARISGKTHNVATTADPSQLSGDIPNMNVGRALIVIALLHVVGLVGVFMQKHFEKKNMAGKPPGESPARLNPTAAAGLSGEKSKSGAITDLKDLPQIQKNDGRHMVVLGDTYESVARKWSINVEVLRKANNDVPLCSGLVLRVPPREIVALEPAEMAALRKNQPQDEVPAMSAQGQRAIRVTPNHNYMVAPRATPVEEVATSGAGTYKVKKGDTFSSIARRYGIDADQLMKHNGISNARSLNEGRTLQIPTKHN